MAYFDEKFLEELQNKISIVDVVGRYCTLKKKGPTNYWACCPLPGHSEKTPSFAVNEVGQFYHCFGCGKSGNMFKFVQEVENVSFIDAVRDIASKCGMEVPESKNINPDVAKNNREKKERLEALMKDTALFYVKNLYSPKAKPYVDYVNKRGFNKDIVNKFGIGCSLDYNSLPTYLKGKGYTEDEMIECGVCSRGEKNDRIFDFEAERFIVPIINSMGKVIAFGGRVLEKKPNVGKYKNTSNTVLFDKRNVLFNINKLKELRNTEEIKNVIMVEGYMDAISLYSAGFKNVVASMGTSLTLEQAKLLKRYTTTVLVSYDGDGAGQNATIRSLDIFANEGFEVKIVKLPDGMDPDDIIRVKGKDFYQKLLDEAIPLIDFKLEILADGKDLNNPSDKRNFVAKALTFIKTIKEEYIQDDLLKKVRGMTGITFETLKRDLNNGNISFEDVKDKEDVVTSVTLERKELSNPLTNAERFVILAALTNKPYSFNYDYSNPMSNKSRDKILDILMMNPGIKPKDIFPMLDVDDIEEFNLILSSNEIVGGEQEKDYFLDCVDYIKRVSLEQQIQTLNTLFKQQTEVSKRMEIVTSITNLTKELNELKRKGK